ncbi:MAG: hypothetical protein K6E17_00285 [Clostridiales bacterium]|nr:hypothetical protein [Clostridiales bacterium]
MAEGYRPIRELIGSYSETGEEDVRRFVEELDLEDVVRGAAQEMTGRIVGELSDKLRKGVTIDEIRVINIRIPDDKGIERQVLDRFQVVRGGKEDFLRSSELVRNLRKNGLVRGTSAESQAEWEAAQLVRSRYPWCICVARESKWQKMFLDMLTENCRKEDIELIPSLPEGFVEYRANSSLVEFIRSQGIRIDPYPHEALAKARQYYSRAQDAARAGDIPRTSNLFFRAAKYYTHAGYTLEASRAETLAIEWRSRYLPIRVRYGDPLSERMSEWTKDYYFPDFPVAEKGYDQEKVDEAVTRIMHTFYLMATGRQALCTADRLADCRKFPFSDNGYDVDRVVEYFFDIRGKIDALFREEPPRHDINPCYASDAVLSGAPQAPYSICVYCGSDRFRNGIGGKRCRMCGKFPPAGAQNG